MKKFILLLFVCQLYAQNFPVSESNSLIFNQYRFGVNLMNCYKVFQKKDGSIITGTYFNNIYHITNTKIISLNHYFKSNELLLDYFEVDNKEIFCTQSLIVIVENKKVLKRISIIKSNENYFSFKLNLQTKELYFNLENHLKGCKKIYKISIIDYKLKMILNDLKNDYQIATDEKGTVYLVKNTPFTLYKIVDDKIIEIANFPELKLDNYYLISSDYFYYHNNLKKELYVYRNKKRINTTSLKSVFHPNPFIQKNGLITSTSNSIHCIYKTSVSELNKVAETTQADRMNWLLFNKFNNSYYSATATDFMQIFPNIKKYPRLFNNSNSNSVFALQQDKKGIIYAGGYTSGLATINNEILEKNNLNKFSFINGSLNLQNHLLLMGENNKGIIAFENPLKYWNITNDVTGFYLYKSINETLYFGTASQGLWFCKDPKIKFGKKISWERIGIEKGLSLNNILTICEDKYGNIWMGQKGIAVYNPKNDKVITWHMNSNEKYFGAMCSLKDNNQTLWFGNSKGELVYYDGKNETDFDFKNFKKINHPLFEKGKKITFIHQWYDYLILGANDRVLVFNLKKWYQEQKVLVKYLNPYESNFSAPTEQNTVLTDIQNENIWFATSDMVYQWKIKNWLSLPTFKIIPKISIKKEHKIKEISPKETTKFKPKENSFDIEIVYQSKDNLPRYINGILVKRGDKVEFDQPNLQTVFHYSNLSAGRYVFYVRVCQQDGSFDIYEYPIYIDNFIWENWWFWVLLSMIPLLLSIYYFKKKNEIAQTKKKLTQLNLSSLSNQFRPHFMLNVLNSIGSQMDEMPHGEKIISRLGESINILYGFSQKNDFFHIFKNEWRLVENIIEIQKSLFIPELKVFIENKINIDDSFKIPIGLIQIPVENALLHGLRNKENGDYNLKINFSENSNHYEIEIIDNGVGREKAKEINNFRNNGNGLKTIFEMIEILNKYDSNSINFEIIDVIDPIGTKVLIRIKKEIKYDKINL